MAYQGGNAAGLEAALGGAAGKNNYGAGGDFFIPGKHIVKVSETIAGPSDQKKNVFKAVIASQVLKSEGGDSNWVIEDGKAVRRGEAQPVPAIGMGSTRKQILMSDKGNFESDLGNFCLAVKKTFGAMFHLCEEDGNVNDFLKERWPPSEHPTIRAFVKRADENADATVQADILDIFRLDLAVGLIMHVTCGDKPNKDKTFVINQVAWTAGSADDQGLEEELAEG